MRKILTFVASSLPMLSVQGQESLTIGFIDFYGLRTVTESEVRELLPLTEGDLVSPDDPYDPTVELEIADALGVSRVQISWMCCPEPNVVVLHVGVEETPIPGLEYHPTPTGNAVLPREILETAEEIFTASFAAVRSGPSPEDYLEGHALSRNPEIREIQERYLLYVEQYREQLLEVLHNSGDEEQRAIAATVIGYASDKQSIIPELEYAVLDPSGGVRNNATRALIVLAIYGSENPELGIEISPDMYIDMLNSVFTNDRNKASGLLSILTSSRDPELLARINERSLLSLIEMCGWKVSSSSSCVILERVVGLPEQDELHPKEATIAMGLELLPEKNVVN